MSAHDVVVAPVRGRGGEMTRLTVLVVTALCVAFLIAGCGGGTTSAPWKFAVLCDSRGDEPAHGTDTGVRTATLGPIVADLMTQGMEVVVFPGDLVVGFTVSGPLSAQLTKWRQTMAPVYNAHIPVYAVRGNHETPIEDPTMGTDAAVIAVWRSIMTDLPQTGPAGEEGLTYRAEHRNATFVGFDQYVGRSATFDGTKFDSAINFGMMNPWVATQISNASTPWVFAFAHEGAFIVGQSDCFANAPAERDAMIDALGPKHGVYMCGHDHLYYRNHFPDAVGNSVLEFRSGAAGAPFAARGNEALNAGLDRHVVPTMDFFEGAPADGSGNTNGLPPRFGYLVITVDGNTATGDFRAFMNYDYTTWSMTGATPVFQTLEHFTFTNGH